jgi:hypothetical protein
LLLRREFEIDKLHAITHNAQAKWPTISCILWLALSL